MIWFGWVVWVIKDCRSFNDKYSSYIYMEIYKIWIHWVL